jgi:hypothetical protein
MRFTFTGVPFMLALVLGAFLQPMLPIYNVSRRGLGIVRYHFGETCAALVKSLSTRAVMRLAFLLALVLAAQVFSGDGGTVMLIGAVMPPGIEIAPGLQKELSAYLGRNQGPEFFTSVPHNGVAQQVLVPRNLSINRPLEAIIVRWRGRVAVTNANMGTAAAESPMTILNRISITGTFKGTSLTPIKLQGSTAYALGRLFGARGSSCYINGVRQADPGVPFGQTLANFGNIGNYDIDIWYVIPTWPIVSASSRAWESVPYFWQPEDWADSIQVTLELGDATSFGTVGGATVTFTAFGSAAGTPVCEIYTRYCILGSIRPGRHFRTAAVIRNEQQITAGMVTAAANVRIMPLQKQKTTNIIVKSGVVLTGTTAGVQVFATLSDVQLDKTLIVVDNKFIRNNLSNLASKESVGYQFGTIEPQGYLPFTFIDSQSPRTAFRADDPMVVGSGANFELDTDILTTGANQAVNVVQEMIFADRDDPSWQGTR